MKRNIFQTIEDRGDPVSKIYKHGPIHCKRDDSWAYYGYYFWENDIRLAHFWGKVIYTRYKKKYIICSSTYILDHNVCFDIEGNHEHRVEFEKNLNVALEKGLLNANCTYSEIIQYFKEKKIIQQDAVRFIGEGTFKEYPDEYKVKINDIHFIKLVKEIQICFFEPNCCSRVGYSVIWPNDYKHKIQHKNNEYWS